MNRTQQQIEVNKFLNEQYGGHQQFSFWFKTALRICLFERDIVDSYGEACLLQEILKKRMDAAVSSGWLHLEED